MNVSGDALKVKALVVLSCPTLCEPMDGSTPGVPVRVGIRHPWNFPGKNPGVGSYSPFHGIFLNQELNPGLPCCRQIGRFLIITSTHFFVHRDSGIYIRSLN